MCEMADLELATSHLISSSAVFLCILLVVVVVLEQLVQVEDAKERATPWLEVEIDVLCSRFFRIKTLNPQSVRTD